VSEQNLFFVSKQTNKQTHNAHKMAAARLFRLSRSYTSRVWWMHTPHHSTRMSTNALLQHTHNTHTHIHIHHPYAHTTRFISRLALKRSTTPLLVPNPTGKLTNSVKENTQTKAKPPLPPEFCPTFKFGKWRKPKLSRRRIADIRKATLVSGGVLCVCVCVCVCICVCV